MGIETALGVGAATSLVGGMLGADAASDAARLQKKATDQSVAEQRRQFDLTRTDQLPFLETGQAATRKLRELLGLGGGSSAPRKSLDQIVSELRSGGQFRIADSEVQQPRGLRRITQRFTGAETADDLGTYPVAQAATAGPRFDENALMAEAQRRYDAQGEAATPNGDGTLLRSFTPGDLVNEPGYQFGLREGNKAIENAARARGLFMSPATVKELLRYGQDYAGTKYGEAFNRDLTNRTTTFNMLTGASGGGQVAANTLANAGQASASNIGNLITAGANARGAAGIAGANAYGNALNGIGNNVMQTMFLKQLFPTGMH